MSDLRKLMNEIQNIFEAPEDIKLSDITGVAQDNLDTDVLTGDAGKVYNGDTNTKNRDSKMQSRKANLKSIEDDAKRLGWYVIDTSVLKSVPRVDSLKELGVKKRINQKTKETAKPNIVERFIKKYPGTKVLSDDFHINNLDDEQRKKLKDLGYKIYNKDTGTKNKPAGTYAKITYVVVDREIDSGGIDSRPKMIDPKEYVKNISKLPKFEQDLYNDGYTYDGNDWVKTISAKGLSLEQLEKLKEAGWIIKLKKGKPFSATNTVNSRSKKKAVDFYKLNPEKGGDYGLDALNDEDDLIDFRDETADDSSNSGYFDYSKKGKEKKTTGELMRLAGKEAKAKHNQNIGDQSTIMNLVKIVRSPFNNIQQSDTAFAELLEHTINIAIGRYKGNQYSLIFADIIQLFGIELYKACFTYNPEYSSKSLDSNGQTAKFTTYLFKNMKAAVNNYLSKNIGNASASKSKALAFKTFNKLKDEAINKSQNSETPWTPDQISEYVVNHMNAYKDSNFTIQPNTNSETWRSAYIRFERDAEMYRFGSSLNQINTDDEGDEFINQAENEISKDNSSDNNTDRNEIFKISKEKILNAIKFQKNREEIDTKRSQEISKHQLMNTPAGEEIPSVKIKKNPFTDKEIKYLWYAFGLDKSKPLHGEQLEKEVGANNSKMLNTIKNNAISKLIKSLIEMGDIDKNSEDEEELINAIMKALKSYSSVGRLSDNLKDTDYYNAKESNAKDHESYGDEDYNSDQEFIKTAGPDFEARRQQMQNQNNNKKTFADKFDELPIEVKQDINNLQRTMNEILKDRTINQLNNKELLEFYHAALKLAKYRHEAGLDDDRTYKESEAQVQKLVQHIKSNI